MYEVGGVDSLPRWLCPGRRVSVVACRRHLVYAPPSPVHVYVVAVVFSRCAQRGTSLILVRYLVSRVALAFRVVAAMSIAMAMALSRAARKGRVEEEAATSSWALLALSRVIVVAAHHGYSQAVGGTVAGS